MKVSRGLMYLGFVMVCCANLWSNLAFEYRWLELYTKPLIVPWLMWLFATAPGVYLDAFAWRLLAALFFSWGGDVLLMREGGFILGLLSFLIAHVCFISAYLVPIRGSKEGVLWRSAWLATPFVLYLGFLFGYLYPYLGDLRFSLLAYASVLTLMGIFALDRGGRVSALSFRLVLAGAVLFIISDSCIAINKFVYQGQMPLGGFAVMLTYIAAQWLITEGAIKQYQSA